MKRIEIGQEPYATTLLSVIKGISDYYNLDYSRAFVYGASAHAFLINIHNQLCPSGPYCWNGPWLEKQLKLMGLNMTDLGFYHNESKAEERTELEVKIKRFIDKDIPCSVLNLDNQIVCGYDDDGLLFVQPWKGFDDSTPARLTYGTWKEFKGEIHVSFQAYESFEPATKYEIVKQSLITAVEILENGDKYQFDNYALGLKAYDYFLEAFETQSMGHGCWWNANVWGECREMASQYIAEIKDLLPELVYDECETLVSNYHELAECLKRVGDKEADFKFRVGELEKAKDLEVDSLTLIKKVVKAL